MAYGFDSDKFLDDLQFDEDLSSFSPDAKMLPSPDMKPSFMTATSRPRQWTDEEVSIGMNHLFKVTCNSLTDSCFCLTQDERLKEVVENLFAQVDDFVNEVHPNKSRRGKKRNKQTKPQEKDKIRDLDWALVAQKVANGRNSAECLRRYNKIVGNRATEAAAALKGPWTAEEDQKLMKLVKDNGPKKWSQIAAELPGECPTIQVIHFLFIFRRLTQYNSFLLHQDVLGSNVARDGTII